MNRIDQLLENYRSHVKMPLRTGLPASQRVWFAVYPASDERRLLNRIDEFELVTKDAGHPWILVDLKGSYSRWLASVDEEERAEWFRNPSDIELYAKTEWKDLLERLFHRVSCLLLPVKVAKEITATGDGATRLRLVRLLTILLSSRDSQHTATVRLASSPTYRSSAHEHPKAFPTHRCP